MADMTGTEERFIAKRVIKLFYLAGVSALLTLLLGVCHGASLGDTLAAFFADVVFIVLFAFYLEEDRLHRFGAPDSSEDYMRLAVLFTAGAAAMLAFSFFPAYTAPVFAVSFLLAAGLKREAAIVITVFFDVQAALVCQLSCGALVCYLMLTLLGALIVSMYRQPEYRRYANLTALAVSIAIPVLFYYVENGIPKFRLFLFSGIGACISILFMHFLYDRVHDRFENAASISLDTIVDKNYHLVQEIKRYSQVDYNHALRVSRISAHCAASIDANVKVAAVGGFYYRIGKLGGEPFIENGIRIAQNNCFPSEIIQILSEYNGELAPISTIESAIVHITDTLVTKFELLDRNTLSNSWNRDMVIYQTLNEKSSSGIYDESGLTMNRFLKIREFLAKEEELL